MKITAATITAPQGSIIVQHVTDATPSALTVSSALGAAYIRTASNALGVVGFVKESAPFARLNTFLLLYPEADRAALLAVLRAAVRSMLPNAVRDEVDPSKWPALFSIKIKQDTNTPALPFPFNWLLVRPDSKAVAGGYEATEDEARTAAEAMRSRLIANT